MFGALGHISRLAHAGWVLAREGVFIDVDPGILPPAARVPLGFAKLLARRNARKDQKRLARAMAKLGPSYIKLGQFLATRPDIVGAAAARELEELQDRVAPFPQEQAIATIEASFGAPVATLFSEFGEPIAAASIAQVHRARVITPEGSREVAVKILRPGVERRFARDLRDMYFAARMAERQSPEARRLRLFDVVETLARSVKMEMDFRLEAAAASEYAENTREDADFRVPSVDWDRTAKDVLTIEWIDGLHLSDLPALTRAGFDLPQLGRMIIQSFLRHAVRDGFFHADMHQGNLFIDREGRLAAVDFGIMGRLGPKERRFLAEILFGFITRDYRRVAEVHFEAGYVPRTHRVEDFAQAIRAIGEPIHSRTADQISMAKLLSLLFEITALFDMRTRTELVMLQKTMVVVEGVARTLDPRLDMWSTAEPVVSAWIRDKLGPAGVVEDAGRGLAAIGRFVSQVPELIERTETLAGDLERFGRNGMELSPATIEAIGRAEARRARWGNAALWVIALTLAAMYLIG
ncbi:MAG: 2-polyprenylphenol 6-hydroxylase [Beijerinckiaceae bacterium]|nr:2-polyprenylphenol 6-hydroxylase [Beijerinckiaceae bacterium]